MSKIAIHCNLESAALRTLSFICCSSPFLSACQVPSCPFTMLSILAGHWPNSSASTAQLESSWRTCCCCACATSTALLDTTQKRDKGFLANATYTLYNPLYYENGRSSKKCLYQHAQHVFPKASKENRQLKRSEFNSAFEVKSIKSELLSRR